MNKICKVCKIQFSMMSFGSTKDTCAKCYAMKRTDKDRTGRSSKKDKYPNKDIREGYF